MDAQFKKILKLIVGAGIFLIVVSFIALWLFNDNANIGIGIATGIIAGIFVLLFQKGFLDDHNIPTNPGQNPVNATTPRIKGENQIKLEIEVAKVYLTGIGLAFTVETVFIGLFGKSVVDKTMDSGFYQLAVISVLFIVLMVLLWHDYQNKLKEVEAAFRNPNTIQPTTPPEPTT